MKTTKCINTTHVYTRLDRRKTFTVFQKIAKGGFHFTLKGLDSRSFI